MAFQSNDGFYQSDYNNEQYASQGFNQQPTDNYYGNTGGAGYGYDNSGGFDAGYGQYPAQQPTMMVPGGNQQYSGQIMQPQVPPATSGGGIPGAYSNGFDDEPPLLEELGINFDHIYQKTFAVLNPFRKPDSGIIKETDLTGPLCFCLALGATLLLGGKVSFGYIYGIGGCGVVALYLLLNIMSEDGVGIGCVASVVGYCILPMVFLSSMSIILSLTGALGVILTAVTVGWCSFSASNLFVLGLSMQSQQLLVAYPCALLYGVFALITVF